MDNDQRMDRFEERLEQTRLEVQTIDVRLTRIETRLDQTATKTDLQQAINSMVKWVVGTMFGASVAAVTIMTFVLNNATPKVAPASPAPIIIQLPPATTGPAAKP
jgi:tetrahydromethanopterin S-methyltransferase subunit G